MSIKCQQVTNEMGTCSPYQVDINTKKDITMVQVKDNPDKHFSNTILMFFQCDNGVGDRDESKNNEEGEENANSEGKERTKGNTKKGKKKEKAKENDGTEIETEAETVETETENETGNGTEIHVLRGIKNKKAICCKYKILGKYEPVTTEQQGSFKEVAMVENSLIKSLHWNKFVMPSCVICLVIILTFLQERRNMDYTPHGF